MKAARAPRMYLPPWERFMDLQDDKLHDLAWLLDVRGQRLGQVLVTAQQLASALRTKVGVRTRRTYERAFLKAVDAFEEEP